MHLTLGIHTKTIAIKIQQRINYIQTNSHLVSHRNPAIYKRESALPVVSVLLKTLEKLASDTNVLFAGWAGNEAPNPLDCWAHMAGCGGAGCGAAKKCSRYLNNNAVLEFVSSYEVVCVRTVYMIRHCVVLF